LGRRGASLALRGQGEQRLPVAAGLGLRGALAHPGNVSVDLRHDGTEPGLAAQALEIRVVAQAPRSAGPRAAEACVDDFAQACKRLVALPQKGERLPAPDTESQEAEAWPIYDVLHVRLEHSRGPLMLAEPPQDV